MILLSVGCTLEEPGEIVIPAATQTALAEATPTSVVPRTPEPTSTTQSLGEHAIVASVTDGDTIRVDLDGGNVPVRLLLIDTPEVFGGVDCYGREASAFMKQLLPPGTPVLLEKDVSEVDRFDRLLRYIYLEDGRMVNELAVSEGYAVLSTYPPDVRHVDLIRAAEQSARTLGRGLWEECSPAPEPTPEPVPTLAAEPTRAPPPLPPPNPPAPTTTIPPSANCDSSYPDVCLPVGSADYDCAGGRGNGPNYIDGPIRVLPPDPHGLDGNYDGWGCE